MKRKPQDLTLSSDDEQQPKKKPKTAEPAEPENVVSRKTVEAAIAVASKWRGAHTRIAGGDDVDEDEDVAKARRLMRTTQSYEDVEFPAIDPVPEGQRERAAAASLRSVAAAVVLLRPSSV